MSKQARIQDNVPTEVVIKKGFFNTIYLPHLYKTNKYNIYWGGRASGKTIFIIQKNIIYLYNNPGKNMTVVMKEYNGMYDKVIEAIISFMEQIGLQRGVHFTVKLSPYKIIIHRPNQKPSIIKFKGGDSGEKMKGVVNQDIVWFEEANNIPPSVFRGIVGSLRDSGRDNVVYISFNPESEKSWLKRYFFNIKGIVEREAFDEYGNQIFDENGNEVYEEIEVTEGGYEPKDITTVHSTYRDNAWGGDIQAKLAYIRQTIEPQKVADPMVYEVWSKGIWGTLGRRVYTNWKVASKPFDYLEMLKENPKLYRAYGLDHGYDPDPNAFVASLIDKENKKIYVYANYLGYKQTPDILAKWLKESGYARARIFADSSEKKTNELLRKYGILNIKDAEKGANSIMPGIKYIKQYQIIIHPDCVGFKKEIESYHFKMDEATDMPTEKPADKQDDHLLDAFRYSVQEVENIQTMKRMGSKQAGQRLGVKLPY